MKPVLPGAMIGILGSGQLGRMLAIEARKMGYRVATFSPDTNSPTGQVADLEVVGAYDDLDAIRAFARQVDVVTFEFENVSSAATEAAREFAAVRPNGNILHITQNRLREKTYLASMGIPITPFQRIGTMSQLRQAVETLGVPAVLKTAGFGYDGKGQRKIESVEQAEAAFHELQLGDNREAIYEKFVPFTHELSVVAARGIDGEFVTYGATENIHENHILDVSIAPGRFSKNVQHRAVELTRTILDSLEVVGVLCVELFLTKSDELIVNELAPRPHNSGHFTLDACSTSQFEQQLRAICGLPLGSTEQFEPAVMTNLLGDLWSTGEPNWLEALRYRSKLHLYGKAAARAGRKMGHMTTLAPTVEEALATALASREALRNAAPQRKEFQTK